MGGICTWNSWDKLEMDRHFEVANREGHVDVRMVLKFILINREQKLRLN
jgi:hypothetical protein